MWKRMKRALRNLWPLPSRPPSEGRTDRDRARFWAEVRQGEREAEANSRP